MADTVVMSGSLSVTAALIAAISGEKSGNEGARIAEAITFAAAGGSAPTISGFLKGLGTAAAGDLLLAHATDPLQGMGSADYSEDFVVAGTKIKMLFIKNRDATNTISVKRGAANGLPIFDAADDQFTAQANGGFILLYFPSGTAALTTGSNDKLTIAVSGGTPQFDIVVAYGP